MSKNRNSRAQGNMNYNRPSAGYQKNLYKQKLNQDGVKAPKSLDPKKLKIGIIAGGVVLLAISILLILKLKWWGLLISVLLIGGAAAGLFFFMRGKQKEIIKYYKAIGMTESMYMSEMRRRNTDEKQLKNLRKIWRSVKD